MALSAPYAPMFTIDHQIGFVHPGYSIDVRLDISHIDPDTSTIDANILKLEQIIDWFKNEALVGFYDLAALLGPPLPNYPGVIL